MKDLEEVHEKGAAWYLNRLIKKEDVNTMSNKNNKRRVNEYFDKTEHDFLMERKRRGVEVIIYLKGEPNGQFTGKILDFGARTIKLEDGYSGKPLLVYKSAISGIGEDIDESDGEES